MRPYGLSWKGLIEGTYFKWSIQFDGLWDKLFTFRREQHACVVDFIIFCVWQY